MYSEKSENYNRFRSIFLQMFDIFCPIWILLVFVLLKDAKLQEFFLAPCCKIYRVTEEAQVAETAVWPIPFLINMFISVLFLFAITAAGIVPCGGPKKSPRSSSIVQIFSFWSFEISEGVLRNQKTIIGLFQFFSQCLIYLAPFGF